jgi:hypothetical protein
MHPQTSTDARAELPARHRGCGENFERLRTKLRKGSLKLGPVRKHPEECCPAAGETRRLGPEPFEFSLPPLQLRMKLKDGILEVVFRVRRKIRLPDKRLENT